jgi:capsular exopolysaccharide synthesis family protein
MTNKCLLSYWNPRARAAAQFREIRNNIDNASKSGRIKTLLVTSPAPRDGKTTTVVNLAISKTQRGEKVLIVDANMRNPVIHDIFNVPSSPGLMNVLSGSSSFEDSVYPTGIARLDVLPFGSQHHHYIEWLGSQIMRNFLETANKKYDCVILDSAPLLDALDTSALAGQVDGVVLVLTGGVTQRQLALKAKRTLEFSAKAPIVGVILNERVSGATV